MVSGPGFEPLPALFQANFGPEEFARRREAVFSMLEVDDVALLQGAAAPRSSEFFRQANDFFYLSGVEVPHAYLLLDVKSRSTTLYCPPDSAVERSEGRRLSADNADEARSWTGIEAVEPLESLALDLQRLVLKHSCVRCYTPLQPAEGARGMRDQLLRATAMAASDPWDACPTRRPALFGC